MRLHEITYDGGRPIDGYGPGFFRIGGEVHHGALLLLPEGGFPWGGYADTATLLARAEAFDVLLVGTGSAIAQVPPDFRAALEGAGVGIELMATPAACRTYNVLLAEGRRIGAALLPVNLQ